MIKKDELNKLYQTNLWLRILKLSYQEGDCRIWDGAGNKTPTMKMAGVNKTVCQHIMNFLYPFSGTRYIKRTCGNKKCINPEHFRFRTQSKIAVPISPKKFNNSIPPAELNYHSIRYSPVVCIGCIRLKPYLVFDKMKDALDSRAKIKKSYNLPNSDSEESALNFMKRDIMRNRNWYKREVYRQKTQ